MWLGTTDLITESVHRDTKRSGQAKITDFEFTTLVDQQILWLEIPVQDSIIVTKGDSLYGDGSC